MHRFYPDARLLCAVFAAIGMLLLAGCTDYDVPGAGEPWPKLSDFPERPDAEEMDKRRRRLIGKFGDPIDALPKPADTPARPPDGALKVAVIQFSRAGQELDGTAMAVLAQVAAWAQQSDASVLLFGYASRKLELAASGSGKKASLQLAADRVRAVGVALIEAGVPADNIWLISRGTQDPAWSESALAGEAGNRRVEIYFTD